MVEQDGSKQLISPIENFGATHRELYMTGLFPANGYTLLEFLQDFMNPSTGLLENVRKYPKIGETFPDFVDTRGARKDGRGVLVGAKYIQKPRLLIACDTGGYEYKGGVEISCDFQPDGWNVPKGEMFCHPQVGTAVATLDNRDEAVRANLKYIQSHLEKFAGFLAETGLRRLVRSYLVSDIDHVTAEHDPEQLARLLTSHQAQPVEGVDMCCVQREYHTEDYGLFDLTFPVMLGDMSAVKHIGARDRRVLKPSEYL